MSAANGHSNTTQKALSQSLLPTLVKALTIQLAKECDEDDVENRYAIADALSEVMYDGFTHKAEDGQRVAQISVFDAKEIVASIMALIQSCLSRRLDLMSEMLVNLIDNDHLARCEEKVRAEAELLTHLVDSVGYQLKSLGEKFLPIFAELVAGPLGQLLTTSGTRDVRARFSAVCLFDDCIEHCGLQAASTYSPMLLQGIIEGMDDKKNEGDMDLKQASVYGIAQIARHAPKSLPPLLSQELLMGVYNISKEVETVPKSEMKNLALIENAVSSIASLALFQGSPLFDYVTDKAVLIHVFLCGLPLIEDYCEAQVRGERALLKCISTVHINPNDNPSSSSNV